MTPAGPIEAEGARFTQAELTSIWAELSRSNQMVGAFSPQMDPETSFMVTFFGDSIEHLLYVQPLAGDTLYDEPMAHQMIYARSRPTIEGAWSAWRRRS